MSEVNFCFRIEVKGVGNGKTSFVTVIRLAKLKLNNGQLEL